MNKQKQPLKGRRFWTKKGATVIATGKSRKQDNEKYVECELESDPKHIRFYARRDLRAIAPAPKNTAFSSLAQLI